MICNKFFKHNFSPMFLSEGFTQRWCGESKVLRKKLRWSYSNEDQ